MRRRRALVGLTGVAIIVVAVVVGLAATKPNDRPAAATHPTIPRATTTTLPNVAPGHCPLTDEPAAGGTVPAREALAVKIGNEPDGARPQSGLDEADVVFDTPVEGGLRRYIAVFQCTSASSIGPIRSIRLDDFHLLSVFSHLEIAFVGGDDSNQQIAATSSWIDDANEFLHYGAYMADPDRVAPDSTYSSTSALWGLFPPRPAPSPIFIYTPSLPAGAKPVESLAMNFSPGTDVLWKWDPQTGVFDHTYEGVPDVDALSNEPVTATNIVVQIVDWHYGTDIDHDGNHDVIVTSTGEGPGYVLRGGEEIPVTWHRATGSDPTTYTDQAGQPVGLAPGRTWVEIELNTNYDSAGDFVLTP